MENHYKPRRTAKSYRCALCEVNLDNLSVSCRDAEYGGFFNICFKCANTYFEKYPEKSVNDIARIISSEL